MQRSVSNGRARAKCNLIAAQGWTAQQNRHSRTLGVRFSQSFKPFPGDQADEAQHIVSRIAELVYLVTLYQDHRSRRDRGISGIGNGHALAIQDKDLVFPPVIVAG